MPICARTIRAVAVATLAILFSAATHAGTLTVKTAQGVVRGKEINNAKARAFLGLPYAAAPVGDLRWRPPAEPARWKGTRDATKYGPHCMQSNPFPDMLYQDPGYNEDCLFLNVFTPANAELGSKLPVMVWIHGGGYFAGSASEPRHNGDFLPTHGVILVTINYRLGVLGFLATPELAREEQGAAGNYGLMDQIAALQWVKENIAEFGGDPANVTIFGESAGSMAVSALMAAQPARGLFAKAIGESGSSLQVGGPKEPSYLEVQAKDQEWVTSLGMDIAHLRLLPADEIIAASTRKDAPLFWPVVDGKLFTEPLSVTYAAGRQAHVPLLAGWNRDEWNYDERTSLAKEMTAEKWKSFAVENFGGMAAQFLKFYSGDSDTQAKESARDYQGDDFIVTGSWRWIDAQAKTGDAPVYRYQFDLPAPASQFHSGGQAFHSDEIEYVFGTLDTRLGATWRAEDRKLSDQMMSYWTNFAKTGDPNGNGLPQWPRFDKTGQVLHLDSTIKTGPDTQRDREEFMIANMKKRQ
jgi:para-nitrobenzyl esterase